MPVWHKLKKSTFAIKLMNWEYWPFGIVQFPLFFYYPWLSLRSGSLTFFCASNPGITMGGMFGESKFEVLQKVPSTLKPKTILIRHPATRSDVLSSLEQNGFVFPVIFKPDLGERGFMVKKICNAADVDSYLQQLKSDFLIQDLVDLPEEFGVFYRRFPDADKGEVTSVVMKEMLSVTGDGRSTLRELILKNDRAKLQWEKLKKTFQHTLYDIIPSGQKLELVSVGNHCLGTKFINANDLITPELSSSFDRISRSIDGFYFGRFDLRCSSKEHLAKGDVMILELNGCGAEPAHIYDPAFPLWRAVVTLLNHWYSIFEIARQNKSRGHKFIPLREAISHYQNFKGKVRNN